MRMKTIAMMAMVVRTITKNMTMMTTVKAMSKGGSRV